MEEKRYMLTTVDNPFNPYKDFDSWYGYDTLLGYNSLQLLARVVKSSNDLSEPEQQRLIQLGIDEIVRYNVSGRHTKVAEPAKTEGNEEDSAS